MNYLSKYLSAILFLIAASFFFQSCKKDKCKDQYCLNGGACLDGTCQCPTGYSGAHCETNTGGGSGNNGQAMFWANQDLGCGNISVSVNGQSGAISSYFASGPPSCGTSGCATF